jgi:predicted dehydrogenase
MTTDLNRRDFLKHAGAGMAGISVLSSASLRSYAANDTVNVGIVGVGGQGGVNRREIKGCGAAIVALCDADTKRLEGSKKDHPGARTWTDFRKMLQEQKEIDAVCVSTPDHLHAPAAMMAIKLGKAADTEKPLTHSIFEARALGEAARKHKVATQMDNEGHSSADVRRCAEWLLGGAIGKVREATIWTDRPIWPQGIAKRPPSKPVPRNLVWDLWLGPAPERDYHDHLHPFAWRGWWDFGTGALGDMGCHWWDAAFWGLRLGEAKTIGLEAEQGGNSDETGPNWSTVIYEFPARGDLPPVRITWMDGRKGKIQNLPPAPAGLEPGRKLAKNGAIYVGERATIVNDGHRSRIIPAGKDKELAFPKPFSLVPPPPKGGHKMDWITAIKGGRPAGSNFPDYGGPLCEIVLLGNLAVRTGKKMTWDVAKLEATNCPVASQYVRRDYRKGWEL